MKWEPDVQPNRSLRQTTDPRGLVTRQVYDDLGRQITTIANYLDGTPSGPTGDDDVHTRTVYTNGLRTQLWVDLDGDGVRDADDQVTTYAYGTTKGAGAGDSRIATGHLLKSVAHPDAVTASDQVSYAYNAQFQTIHETDQAGNVIQTDYDTAGRETHRRVTTLAGGFDGDVRRVSTVYDSLGGVLTVSQYDDATAGSGTLLDQVRYAHDGWGNVLTFEQDRNGAVDGSGSVDDYQVEHAYEKATTGRNAIRRTSTEYGYGTAGTALETVTYQYLSTNGRHDEEVGRVTRIQWGTTDIVGSYAYNGVGTLVGWRYPEPDVAGAVYDPADEDSFRDLDRFDRVTTNRWFRELASSNLDFFRLNLAYDRHGNIARIEDDARCLDRPVRKQLGGARLHLPELEGRRERADRRGGQRARIRQVLRRAEDLTNGGGSGVGGG